MPENDFQSALEQLSASISGTSAGTEILETKKRKKRTRGDEVTDILNARNQTPFDFLKSSLEGNVDALPSILQLSSLLSGQVGSTNLEATGRGTEFFSGITKDAAASSGVDIEQLTRALTGIGAANLGEGQNIVNDANSLISGQFFNSPVGRESLSNLMANIAPGLSPAGLDATQSTFGGATSDTEVDQITSFLQNSIAERDKGFALRGQGIAARDAAASRLGGVLTFGTQFGQQAAAQGSQFGTGVANLTSGLIANQLLTPAAFGQDAQNDANISSNLFSIKETARAQDKAQSAANSAGLGSAIGQIAGLVLAPFTGGLSLLPGAAAGAAAKKAS